VDSVEIVAGDQLDYEAYADLQRASYAELLAKNRTSADFMTPGFYRWKYAGFSLKSRIAVVWRDKHMVAANAMYPCPIWLGQQRVLGWQSCDTATRPDSRGKGYFQNCLLRLQEAIAPGEIFFGFPNQNSMRGFVKIGWIDKGIVTTWVNPIARWTGRHSDRVIQIERFDARQDELAHRLRADEYATLSRNADFLNWRYADHPQVAYSLFVLRQHDRQSGFAVVRTAMVSDRALALVLAAQGLTGKDERTLLRHMAWWARSQKVSSVVMMDTRLSRIDGALCSYAPVPSRLLPKKQVLMGSVPNPSQAPSAGERILASQWRVQMGDWDAF